MKILQIHNKYIFKGGEDTVVENERLLLQSHNNEVMLCEFDNKNLENVSKIKLFFKTLFNISSYRKVQQCIKDFKPDVIHIHNIYYEASLSALIAVKKSGVPSVMTLHNYRLACIQGLLYRDKKICEVCIDKNALYGIKHKCFKNSFYASFQLTLLNSLNMFFLKHCNIISKYICLSNFTKNKISFLIKDNSIVKPNFVEENIPNLKEPRENTYLYVGRLDPQKGLDFLLNTFIENRKQLEIIGSGPLEYLVKDVIKQNANIRYLGFRDKKFIIEKLKQSKALIVPSLTYEGQPMTILEAFSTGTPVIASNIQNLDELIIDKVNGLLFKPNDINSLNNTINFFDMGNNKYLYQNALSIYQKRFSPKSNYIQLMNIYKEAILSSS
jgi:glycosyltransferase involved in cell wall biosynthesis